MSYSTIPEYSNKSCPSMVAHHQAILQHSTINQKTVDFTETDTICFDVVDLWRLFT